MFFLKICTLIFHSMLFTKNIVSLNVLILDFKKFNRKEKGKKAQRKMA